jgi:copper chaperone CopZ
MHRRDFIQALAGVGASVSLLNATGANETTKENTTVTWTVSGFSCATCTVGLQTILERQKGIARVNAFYPSGEVQVGFDSNLIAASVIQRLIRHAGFEIRHDGE